MLGASAAPGHDAVDAVAAADVLAEQPDGHLGDGGGVGGVLYTLGALALATHRPDPWPRVFGYHEVWHAATLAAATSQAIGIWLLAV